MEGNVTELSDILKKYVFERRKINPNISKRQIARNLGVSSATLYRILNYHTYPTSQNLIKLCKSIPELKNLVTNNTLEVTKESKTKYIGKELETLLLQKNLFLAYAFALSTHGVTDEEITYCMGPKGKQALKTLIKKGFVMKIQNNRYRAIKADRGIILSFDVLKKHIEVLAENYKPENKANNYIYYKMESLNEKGFLKLHEIYKETHRKVQKLMESEEYKGDMQIFAVGFMDMFFMREPANKQEEEK